jgi:integrase
MLTEKRLLSLKPAAAGTRYGVADGLVPGLAVRVTETGHKSFVLVARYPGSSNPTRRALGEYGAITLAGARQKARQWLELLQSGKDPKNVEEAARREEQRRQAATFAGVAEAYIVDHVLKGRRGEEVAAAIRREFVGRWGARPISDITRSDVIAMVKEIKTRAPYQARNLLGSLKTMFDWAIEQDVYGLEASPCDRIKPTRLIGEKLARKRVLNDAELRAVWHAAGQIGFPFGAAFRMMILTGQRRGEVGGMRWSELDLDKAIWTIPAERMKSDAPHVVPLVVETVALLRAVPRFAGEYVFTARDGRRPVRGFQKAKEKLDRLMSESGAEVRDWRLHDLRRTARTHFSAIPSTDLVRELAISHTKPGLHKVYDQHAYLDERRDLLQRWAKRLMAIVEPPPPNVLPLAGRRKAGA